ncbi:hypothetical protein, partial [Escherichia coli]|uniref:hypothetical protein n=1 Tax=Escherichia coli TaxID=562 RepID=UPI002927E18D
GGAFAVTHHPFISLTGGTAYINISHWSTSKTPSYTKSVSWQHYQFLHLINEEKGDKMHALQNLS